MFNYEEQMEKAPQVTEALKDRIEYIDYVFDDPILGLCNLTKAMRERNKAIKDEYEAFDRIYTADGILGKSNSSSKL